MRDETKRKAAAAIVAATGWFALGLQLWLLLGTTRASGGTVVDALWQYLSFFTVLTNLFIAVVATATVFRPDAERGLAGGMARGCATTAIVVVGISYHLLLRNVWDPQGWQLVADVSLHYVMPILGLLWWLWLPPQATLGRRALLVWAIYPLAYLVYALLRGAATGRYAYPFIDVAALGYPRVTINAVVLAAAFFAVGVLLRLAARRR